MVRNSVLMNLNKSLKNKELLLYFRKSKPAKESFAKGKSKKLFDRASGIYFGEEFCEYLTPSLKETKEIFLISQKAGKSFTFITTITSNKLIKFYLKIFDFLNQQYNCKVVVNDWGVLYALKHNFKNIKPVLGRLLMKNKRYIYKKISPDTEGLNIKDISEINRGQLNAMRQTNFMIKEYQEFLKKYNIESIDIDLPPQGITLGNISGFSFGFYYPWGHLTNGRTCTYSPNNRFYVSSTSCKKECLRENNSLIKSNQWNADLLKTANALLYRLNINEIPNFIRRVIYQIDI